ncbi:hypothetical protein ABZP36_011540 [Zizania latifolia]
MATPARRARGRRPFAVVVAPPSPAARNRVLSENSMESEVLSFSQCLRRFGKFAARETRPGARDGDGKAVKKCSAASICSPGSRKAASRTPRTGGRRRLLLSLSSDPGAQSRGARRRKKTPEVRKTGSSWPPPPTNPEEIDMSYPSIASWSEVSFNGGRRSSARDEPRQQRRYFGIGSSEKRRWRKAKAIGVTSQHPFNLRTEQRGKVKEENLVQRMKKKLIEEESLRNPLAQGLPWTTDEPEEKRAASRRDYDKQDRRVKGTEVFVGRLPWPVTERVLREVSDTDPYEAAVVSLPSAVEELLLCILRLRISSSALDMMEGRFLSATRYNTDIGPEFISRSSAEYSTARQQGLIPFTGEPYRFDPFTGEPIRPESNPRCPGSLY